jgi:hypothetical protein
MSIFRNPDGFSTVNDGGVHAGLTRPLPFSYHVLFEDFVAAASATPPGWTHSTVGTTPAVTLGTGSTLLQTLPAEDNATSALYGTTATLTIAAGKKAYFEAKVKVDKGSTGTIGEQELFVGISTAATTTNFMAADGLSMTADNAIGFVSYDGSTSISCVSRSTDVESVEAAATTYADATWMVLAWDYDGSTIKFYKDSNLIATITATPSATAMTPMLYVKAGEAKAAVMTTDYIFFAVER